MSTYEKAVFLTTVAAAVDGGVNLSNAKFVDFYRSTKPIGATEKGGLPYGIKVIFASNKLGGRSGFGKGIGAIEVSTRDGVTTIDVDLFNPKRHPIEHARERSFNKSWHRPTHPGDVARQLLARGLSSGVTCVACKPN